MLLAEASSGVLVRSFVIALVVVAPFAWWQWRRVRAARLARAARAAEVEPAPRSDALPTLESVIARIAEHARTLEPGRSWTLEVPRRMSLDGAEADPALADTLVRDALRRDGLQAVDELDAGDHRVLHCVKR
jgi:hypothetical protein